MVGGKRSVGLLMMALATVVVALLGACPAQGAVVHKVGDSAGWTTIGNVDYAKWASANTFHVGDSLLFEYNSQFHNVKQVSRNDFQSCNATSPIASYTSGSDSITLKRPGHFYFLCGFPGHCQTGQKVDVLVTTSSAATVTPSASPTPSPDPGMLAPGPAQSTAPNSKLSLLFTLIAIHVFSFAIAA